MGKKEYIKAHFLYIKDDIQKNITYPRLARKMGWEGKVVVSFVICEDGTVINIKIVKSSGFALLDKNAVESIKKAVPFPSPPVRAELVVPVSYRLS
jgi:protein TonB